LLSFCVLLIPNVSAQEISLAEDGRFVVPRGLAEDYITMSRLIPKFEVTVEKYRLAAMADSLLISSLNGQVDLVNEHLQITMAMTAAEQVKAEEYKTLWRDADAAYKKEKRLRRTVTYVGVATAILVLIFK